MNEQERAGKRLLPEVATGNGSWSMCASVWKRMWQEKGSRAEWSGTFFVITPA